jgi:cell wall-associated NlpC family hydrolase
VSLVYQHLIGRSFLWGVRDCLGLLIELYRESFGIEITNYARPTDWSSDNESLIRKLYEREGFQMITDWRAKDLRPGDVLCMAIGESEPNHLAIYVGDNKIAHHLYGRLSSEEPFRDFYRNSTCFIIRHPDVPDLRPVHPDTDIRSLLRDRYRVEAAE